MKLIGVDWGFGNYKQDVFYGFLFGIGFILVARIIPSFFSIAIPSVPASAGVVNQYFIQLLLAPIIENLLFFMGLLFLLSKFVPKILAVIITSAAFSGFHYWAWTTGIYTANNVSFVSGFIFALISLLIVLWRENQVPAIIFHAVINAGIVLAFVVVGV